MNNFFLIIIILILISITYRLSISNKIKNGEHRTLESDGFKIIKNILNQNEIDYLKKTATNYKFIEIKDYIMNSCKIKTQITNILGSNYIFQDYIFMIKKSQVHTCHRDNNGIYFNPGQKNRSYTIIFFLEKMDRCLEVIPKSHISKYSHIMNLTDHTKSVLCNPGDCIIFDANLIHNGSFNKKENNMRIQMKVSHRNDIKHLMYYQKFNKYLDCDNNIPKFIQYIQKHFTCQFPIISDLSQQKNIKSSRGSSQGSNVSSLQKMFSYVFYGNKDFYDLPDAKK